MPNSLHRRLDALEAQHAPPDYSAEQAVAAEQFWAKLDDLIERNRDIDLSPNSSHIERVAWWASRDPEKALDMLKTAAQEAKRAADTYEPQHRVWRVRGKQ